MKVCEDMGGNITLLNERTEAGEKMADILVRSSQLHGISIHGDIIPTLIDEIPIIAVMAACAEGTTIIRRCDRNFVSKRRTGSRRSLTI